MKQRKGSRLDVVVTDGQRSLSLVFFAQVGFHRKELQVGRQGLFSGKVTLFGGTRQLAHPAYELLPDDVDGDLADPHADPLAASFAARPIPIYPATASLASWRVAKCVAAALPRIPDLPDPVPAEVAAQRGLVPRATALERIHVPRDWADVESARARLRFEEAFVLQAALALRRAEARSSPTAPRPGRAGGLLDAFDARLPFALTEGQRQVSAEIAADLAADLPMQRLLQGEVGSGKTVVALRAMLAVVDSGGQAALLAPTEVLAQQHHRAILALLGPLAERGLLGGSDEGTGVALLTGSMSTGQRRQALLDLASGDGRARRRDARAARGQGRLLRPRPRGRRRAAPLRRRAARRPARQGPHAAAPAGDDGHADPAHGGHDGLRRPRGLDPDRAARRPNPHRDPCGARARQAALPRAGLAAGARGGRPRAAGVRRVPADRR